MQILVSTKQWNRLSSLFWEHQLPLRWAQLPYLSTISLRSKERLLQWPSGLIEEDKQNKVGGGSRW